MMLVRTYLAPSEIQGLGVFAGEFVRAGTQLWALNPKFDIFVYVSELERLPVHMLEFVDRYSYPHLELPGVRVVDCDDGKFMNHSESPNTDFRIFETGFAITDIAAGDEITCNYYEFDPDFRGFGPPAGMGFALRSVRNGNGRRSLRARASQR
jgi:SET domain-containing protein